MSSEVVDNPSNTRYELVIDGMTAYVTYERAPGQITFIHTEVPPALSGHCVGSTFARTVLEMARANGDKVVARCPFVAAFVRNHPEFQDLLAEPLS
jgi:uncharacterized protein